MFSISNVAFADKGFYINLDSSLDRRNHVEKQIEKFNIKNIERFSALTDELRQCTATKSQKAVFEKAISENLNTVFIAEDDFDILENIKQYNNNTVSLEDPLS